MRILILGGTGFIGSNLASFYLQRDHDVTVLGRGNKTPIVDGVKFIQRNLLELRREDVVNMDCIINAASTVNDYNLLNGTTEDIQALEGAQILLEKCRHYNPWARIIYISTFFVNGDPPELPVTEYTECFPKGMYGVSKLAAEHTCRVYQKVFNLNVSIARLTNVYGPLQRNASQKTAAFNWMIQTCIQNGIIPLYDEGEILRDYIYVDDAVRGIETVRERGKPGELYLVGSGQGVSFLDMVNMMQKITGGGRIRDVDSPGFHQRVGIRDFWIDNSKLRGLGWEPHISLEEGIKLTVESYEHE